MGARLITILMIAALAASDEIGRGSSTVSASQFLPARSVQTADPITRALALATFDSVWTRVRDFHYDTLMNGVDWQGARDSLRPRAHAARTTGELRHVIDSLLARLGESHFSLIPREVSAAFAPDSSGAVTGTPGDVGLEMRLVGNQVLVTRSDSGSPARGAGVRAGWRIMSLGNIDVATGLAAADKAGSLQAARVARMRLVLRLHSASRGGEGTSVSAVVRDPQGVEKRIDMVRRRAPGEPAKYGNLPTTMVRVSWSAVGPRQSGACAGTIRMNTWLPAAAAAFDAAVDSLRMCRGIIIDLRGNTGGVANMVIGISGHFLATRDTLGMMRTRTSQLRFIANPRTSNAAGATVTPFSGELAILVDELSASTSEIFANSLQALGRARIFGDTTAGQALPSILHRLPNDDVLMLAIAEFRGPRGERIEGRGVVPDVVRKTTVMDLIQGRDPVMDAALQWMSGETQQASRER
jgi:carboxyl-terminal processing protease